MKQSGFIELCAYMAAVWGRELSTAQKAAGFKLVGAMPDSAVENAVVKIAEEGAERMPPWSVVFKVAKAIADADRERMPALPAGDSLSDAEHDGAMTRLISRQTPEQRRRAQRVTLDTARFAMKTRLKLAGELLGPPFATLGGGAWDKVFDRRVAEVSAAEGLA